MSGAGRRVASAPPPTQRLAIRCPCVRIAEGLTSAEGWSRSLTLFALLLGASVVGCGAGRGATLTKPSSRAPVVLAAEVARAQAVIDDPSASAASVDKAARFEQLAFRKLAERRRLRRATLARLPTARARSAVTAALRAADALARIVLPERRFPHWRIVTPLAPRVLLGYFEAAADRYRLPWEYLAAIELVETRMGRIRGLSPAGAEGPMQFMPATWAEYGHGSINRQHDATMAAARFLVANGARKNVGRALLRYNASRSYVVAVESYAREMRRDKRAFYGYYSWRVLYQTNKGTFLLPLGYPQARPERLPG